MFKVAAFAEESERVYVYYIDVYPQGTDAEEVAARAYANHGMRFRQGMVPELLGPLYTVTWMSEQEEEETVAHGPV